MQCSFLYLILKEEIKSVGGNGEIQIRSAVYLGVTYFPWFYQCSFIFCFLGLHPWHMEVPRLGVKSELQLPAYATATATLDPSHFYDLHHGSQQRRILNPLIKARYRNHVLTDTSQVCYC